jgi:hypothetical protein
VQDYFYSCRSDNIYIPTLLRTFHFLTATMAERRDYNTLARDINLDDITSCEYNANILRMIRDGDPLSKHLFIMNEEDEDDEGGCELVVAEGDHLGWLGYFIGRSEVVQDLYIYYLPAGEDEINSFFEGMSQNRSIKTFELYSQIGVDSWISLGSFLENNRNLANFEVQGFTVGYEAAQNFALALGRMNHNSLEYLSFDNTEISDEGLAEIATALRSQSQLERLDLNNNNIGNSGCIALGNTLSKWPHSNKLETLNVTANAIDDEGLQALVSGMMNCRSLKRLSLSHNQSITAAGLRSLFPLLQSESHFLETLVLYGIGFGDNGAIALAEGLRGNESLKELWLYPSAAGMTSVGWSAFSRLLCDTSTINNTYLSNHTLTKIGDYRSVDTPHYILDYLALNKSKPTDAPISKIKILRSHLDLDMRPFFEWKMKFLPVAVSWLRRARSPRETKKKSAGRKLSALYKFVRGMPDLAVIGYWEGRMIHIEGEKRRLEYEEEITRERLGLSGQPMDETSRNKRMRLE